MLAAHRCAKQQEGASPPHARRGRSWIGHGIRRPVSSAQEETQLRYAVLHGRFQTTSRSLSLIIQVHSFLLSAPYHSSWWLSLLWIHQLAYTRSGYLCGCMVTALANSIHTPAHDFPSWPLMPLPLPSSPSCKEASRTPARAAHAQPRQPPSRAHLHLPTPQAPPHTHAPLSTDDQLQAHNPRIDHTPPLDAASLHHSFA